MDPLIDLVLERDELADLDAAERRLALRSLLQQKMPAEEVPAAISSIAEAIDGFGPVTALMRDERVTDVVVNGPHEVWVDRGGRLERTALTFSGHEHLRAFVERFIGEAGRRVDASRPIADARLPDGSRIHVVMPPLAPRGPLVSIRRFPKEPPSLEHLVASGMLDDVQRRSLAGLVAARSTIAISGGTGSGKTTLLNALLNVVGPNERVVLIEETPELRPRCAHAVSLLARDANVEGYGAVEPSALVRAALRMRPDRIIVGEVRGPEALVALGAMSTGHAGSMLTIHARSAPDALDRMVALALEADGGARDDSLERQVRRAIDVVVHLERRSDGRRRLEHIFPLR